MPRLKKLDIGQGSPQANDMMEMLKKNNKLLNIFRGMANSSAVLDAYLKMSGALKNTSLDEATREAIALAVGQVNRCDYCLAAHTYLGKHAGLDDAAVLAARKGTAASGKLKAAVELAVKTVKTQGNLTDADIQTARDGGLSDGELAEVVALVALNIFTNYFNHLNQTEVDLPPVKVDLD